MNKEMTPEFYKKSLREDRQRSYKVIVDSIADIYNPKTYADVGCGAGWMPFYMQRSGVKICAGFEKNYDIVVKLFHLCFEADPNTLNEPRLEPEESYSVERFYGFHNNHMDLYVFEKFAHKFDLTDSNSFLQAGRYDVVTCFEVLEHIPEKFVDICVNSLCQMGETVIFSAAQPGQDGYGHVNEQPKAYWVEKFDEHGMRYSVEKQLHLTAHWRAGDVKSWYWKNLLVFE